MTLKSTLGSGVLVGGGGVKVAVAGRRVGVGVAGGGGKGVSVGVGVAVGEAVGGTGVAVLVGVTLGVAGVGVNVGTGVGGFAVGVVAASADAPAGNWAGAQAKLPSAMAVRSRQAAKMRDILFVRFMCKSMANRFRAASSRRAEAQRSLWGKNGGGQTRYGLRVGAGAPSLCR